jgi:hypothetical protein
MMVELRDSLITFDEWNTLYTSAREKSIDTEHYGYGIKVNATHVSTIPDLPLKPYFFFLISNRKNREFPIHIDGSPGKQAASINWALSGCDSNSPTEFYQCCDDVKWKDLDNSFFLDNTNDVVKTHSVTMYDNHAYLFRSEILHRGYCNINTNVSRVIVKWELDYETWPDACRELRNRNYI